MLRTTLLLGLLLLSQITLAALPISVDGQKLPSLAPMLETTIPGVVNIATKGQQSIPNNPLFNDPFFRFFFGVPNQPRQRKTESLGSGVIVDAKKGYILTNHHVIKHATQITATLDDGTQLEAKLIGSDPDSDVAVIQVKHDKLTAVALADSDKLRRGDFVVAIGSPFGLMQTVTSGIISALGRSDLGIEGYEYFIQTDASINPGNSGGALVDLNGHLVGINTAILAPSGGNVGIGFAIPINMARAIMEQIIEHGDVKRGALGVTIQNLTPELANSFGLDDDNGAVITEVAPGSAADKAGIEPGDIITEVNGKKVLNGSDLRVKVALFRIGSTVKLTVLRNQKIQMIKAKLTAPQSFSNLGNNLHPSLEGATLKNNQEKSQSSIPGVQVTDVQYGSRAASNGLRPGDVIVAVLIAKKRILINNIEQLQDVINKSKQTPLILNVRRGNSAFFLLLK